MNSQHSQAPPRLLPDASSTTSDGTNSSSSSGSIVRSNSCLSSSTKLQRRNSLTTNNNNNHYPNRRLVSFSTLQVFEFPRIPGDNPSVSSGVPVTLDWNHSHSTPEVDIGYFEYKRRARRVGKELVSSASTRWAQLAAAGFNAEEIQQAANQAAAIRRKGSGSSLSAAKLLGVNTKGKNWDKIHLVLESLAFTKKRKNRRRATSRSRSSSPLSGGAATATTTTSHHEVPRGLVHSHSSPGLVQSCPRTA